MVRGRMYYPHDSSRDLLMIFGLAFFWAASLCLLILMYLSPSAAAASTDGFVLNQQQFDNLYQYKTIDITSSIINTTTITMDFTFSLDCGSDLYCSNVESISLIDEHNTARVFDIESLTYGPCSSSSSSTPWIVSQTTFHPSHAGTNGFIHVYPKTDNPSLYPFGVTTFVGQVTLEKYPLSTQRTNNLQSLYFQQKIIIKAIAETRQLPHIVNQIEFSGILTYQFPLSLRGRLDEETIILTSNTLFAPLPFQHQKELKSSGNNSHNINNNTTNGNNNNNNNNNNDDDVIKQSKDFNQLQISSDLEYLYNLNVQFNSPFYFATADSITPPKYMNITVFNNFLLYIDQHTARRIDINGYECLYKRIGNSRIHVELHPALSKELFTFAELPISIKLPGSTIRFDPDDYKLCVCTATEPLKLGSPHFDLVMYNENTIFFTLDNFSALNPHPTMPKLPHLQQQISKYLLNEQHNINNNNHTDGNIKIKSLQSLHGNNDIHLQFLDESIPVPETRIGYSFYEKDNNNFFFSLQAADFSSSRFYYVNNSHNSMLKHGEIIDMDLQYGLDFGIFNENVHIAQNNNTRNTTAHRFMYSTLTQRGNSQQYDVFTTTKQDLPLLNTMDSVQFQLDLNKMFFEESQNMTTPRLEPPSIFYHLLYCNLDYPTGYFPPDFGSNAPIHSTSSYSSVVTTNDTRVPELALTSQNAPIYITDSLPITSITLDTSENYHNTTLNTLRILIRNLTYTKANWGQLNNNNINNNNNNNNNNVIIDYNNTDDDFDYPTHIDVALPLPYQHFVIKNQFMSQFNDNTNVDISPSDLVEYEKYNQPECQYSFILHTGTGNQQYTHYTSKNSQVGATNSEIDRVLDGHMLFTPYYYISTPHSAKLTTYRYPRYSGITYRKLSFQLPSFTADRENTPFTFGKGADILLECRGVQIITDHQTDIVGFYNNLENSPHRHIWQSALYSKQHQEQRQDFITEDITKDPIIGNRKEQTVLKQAKPRQILKNENIQHDKTFNKQKLNQDYTANYDDTILLTLQFAAIRDKNDKDPSAKYPIKYWQTTSAHSFSSNIFIDREMWIYKPWFTTFGIVIGLGTTAIGLFLIICLLRFCMWWCQKKQEDEDQLLQSQMEMQYHDAFMKTTVAPTPAFGAIKNDVLAAIHQHDMIDTQNRYANLMKQSGRYPHNQNTSINNNNNNNNNNGYLHHDILNEFDFLPEMALPPAIQSEELNNQSGYDSINNVSLHQQQQQFGYEPPIINKVLSTKSYYSRQTETEEQYHQIAGTEGLAVVVNMQMINNNSPQLPKNQRQNSDHMHHNNNNNNNNNNQTDMTRVNSMVLSTTSTSANIVQNNNYERNNSHPKKRKPLPPPTQNTAMPRNNSSNGIIQPYGVQQHKSSRNDFNNNNNDDETCQNQTGKMNSQFQPTTAVVGGTFDELGLVDDLLGHGIISPDNNVEHGLIDTTY